MYWDALLAESGRRLGEIEAEKNTDALKDNLVALEGTMEVRSRRQSLNMLTGKLHMVQHRLRWRLPRRL